MGSEGGTGAEATEMQMVRWMCGSKLRDRVSSEELRNRLGIESAKVAIRRGRLRWRGHVERRADTNWVKKCMYLEVEGKKPRRR